MFTTTLVITFLVLVINTIVIYRDKKAKESLVETMEGDLQGALADATGKKADLAAKDQQIVSLTEKLNIMDGEKTKVEEELIKIRSSLESANAAKKALHNEMDKLAAELVALKGPQENTTDGTISRNLMLYK